MLPWDLEGVSPYFEFIVRDQIVENKEAFLKGGGGLSLF